MQEGAVGKPKCGKHKYSKKGEKKIQSINLLSTFPLVHFFILCAPIIYCTHTHDDVHNIDIA